uniref:Glycerate kinase n=1 Tax=Panagrolaimus sp. PS1159 TaxID=55785 RepID=A0AC35GGA2_9BILA
MSTSKSFIQVYRFFEKAFISALTLLSPESCVQSSLKYSHPKLTVQNTIYDLSNTKIHIIAFGKAAISMVLGAEKGLGDSVIAGGIASVPFGSLLPTNSKIQFFPGAKNNLPDSDSEETTKKIEEYLQKLGSEEIVLFLISGGGSALLPAPIEGITLEEKLKVIKILATNGATIQELNTVRIALSRVKGGKLGRLIKGKAISLIISDIIGDPIELIASGPTVSSIENQKESAFSILQRFCNDKELIPKNVWKILEKQLTTENQVLSNIQNLIVASNSIFVKTVVNQLESETSNEIKASIISTKFEGDATESGKALFNKALSAAAKLLKSNLWNIEIFAGETTVSFPSPLPTNANGGRNQEMALSFFHELIKYQIESFDNPENLSTGIACLGTDGQDGPTNATGAFCSSNDLQGLNLVDLKTLKSEVELHLSSKTSYNFWSNFNSSKNHVKLGKTGHNLMDSHSKKVYKPITENRVQKETFKKKLTRKLRYLQNITLKIKAQMG